MTSWWRTDTESNYGTIRPLRVMTVDYRMFVDPLGPVHAGAIGKIYSFHNGPYDMEYHNHETYIDQIEPQMQEGEFCPVNFVRRTEAFIEVRVDFSNSRLRDRNKIDGLTFRLYPWKGPHRR